jgi:hypothetical protein
VEALFPIFIVLLVFGSMFFVAIVKAVAQRATTRVLTSGVPARGLVLSVSQTGMNVLTNGMRYERRGVVVDVEMQGRDPFQVQGQPLIPKNLVRLVLPGTYVELRVDPSKPQNFAIVGPGNICFVETS